MKMINKLDGLATMKTRLDYHGGDAQQSRMIKDKRRTLDRVVLYSYQGAKIRHVNGVDEAPALITPNVLKQDYDDKILSIGFEYGYQPGDVFEWVNTGTKWLIYLQDLTELAYFRGDIRKCSYEISWEDQEGQLQKTYAAVRGPQEQSIKSIQKYGFSMDLPNYTLNLLLPNTESIREQFTRYAKFYLKNAVGDYSAVCWRVEAVDAISSPGILEVYASEYYANADEDNIEEGIVGGLIADNIIEPIESEIKGATFIKPKKTYTYLYEGSEQASWLFDTSLPIETDITGSKIQIKWYNTYSGQFVLKYGSAEKTIVVESLF